MVVLLFTFPLKSLLSENKKPTAADRRLVGWLRASLPRDACLKADATRAGDRTSATTTAVHGPDLATECHLHHFLS
jgi:hypothetical protein